MTISSDKLAEQLSAVLGILVALGAGLLLPIGAIYAALGLGLVWLARGSGPTAGSSGS